MGEIAEMMLEGFLDEETGEIIDFEAPGYPRRMSAGARGFGEASERQPRSTQCPICKRRFRGTQGLAHHRMAKDH